MRLTLPGFGPSAPPPIPQPVDRSEIREQAERERLSALRARRGRQSTVLTSPTGEEEAPAVNRRTLLGD